MDSALLWFTLGSLEQKTDIFLSPKGIGEHRRGEEERGEERRREVRRGEHRRKGRVSFMH